jgi:hypothetical protein
VLASLITGAGTSGGTTNMEEALAEYGRAVTAILA